VFLTWLWGDELGVSDKAVSLAEPFGCCYRTKLVVSYTVGEDREDSYHNWEVNQVNNSEGK